MISVVLALKWCHYECHLDSIFWQSAMAQVWPTAVLTAAYPEAATTARPPRRDAAGAGRPRLPGRHLWSPGNDDRANEVPGAGGPTILDWLAWLWCFLFGWLPWLGCGV